MFKVLHITYNVQVDKRKKGSIYWAYFIYIFIELRKYSGFFFSQKENRMFFNVKYRLFLERNIKTSYLIFKSYSFNLTVLCKYGIISFFIPCVIFFFTYDLNILMNELVLAYTTVIFIA